jgi:hypothetical protein
MTSCILGLSAYYHDSAAYLLVGALLVFAQGSALAPFIYTIF